MLLVTRADVNDPQTAAFFLARALAPDAPQDLAAGSGGGAGRLSGVQLGIASPEQLGDSLSGGMAPADVVLCEAGNVPAAELGDLAHYLDAGGGVLWVIDSAAAARAIQDLDHQGPPGGVSPVRPSGLAAMDQGQLATGIFTDPILSVFEGPARAELLRATFGAIQPCTTVGAGRSLLTFADGSPLLAARWVGKGRMAVWCSDLSPATTQFIKGPAFAPLMQQIVRELAPGVPLPANPHPGQAARVPVAGPYRKAAGTALHLVGPDGQALRTDLGAVSQSAADGSQIMLAALQEVGPYRLMAGNELVGGVQVELDPLESDLRVEAAAVQAPTTAPVQAKPAAGPAAGVGELDARRIELWPYLVALGMGLLIVEQVVLLVGERRKADPKT